MLLLLFPISWPNHTSKFWKIKKSFCISSSWSLNTIHIITIEVTTTTPSYNLAKLLLPDMLNLAIFISESWHLSDLSSNAILCQFNPPTQSKRMIHLSCILFGLGQELQDHNYATLLQKSVAREILKYKLKFNFILWRGSNFSLRCGDFKILTHSDVFISQAYSSQISNSY